GDARRIEFLYRTVLARRPDSVESQLVQDALAAQRKLFEADPASAEKSLKVGESAPKLVAPAVELASWTVIANLLLNLDETVTRP
ncbi:MAG TPA: hypothetical protein PLV92_19260, partial [Pirellulaceae bacterium]|nr:hypothetical protein [Pirellulaceae bacterium]